MSGAEALARCAHLTARLALALLLAAASALIPGVADRFLSTQFTWSELWPALPRLSMRTRSNPIIPAPDELPGLEPVLTSLAGHH